MGRPLSIVTKLHKRTQRDYLGRMNDDKIGCMRVARRYGQEFWDGDRRYGYGGFRYDGRWEPVARQLIAHYRLTENAKILDVGCGKGYLLYELKKLIPGAEVAGFDVSEHALKDAREEIKPYLFTHRAQDPYPFENGRFDLVVSLTTLHNLHANELCPALKEVERVGQDKYVVVESYRSEAELFNLQCWALTCESFFRPEGWKWVFEQCGYTGDYEFIYFE